MYTIKEVAKKMDISEHTLRFWAKSGFFPFIKNVSSEVDPTGIKRGTLGSPIACDVRE